MLCVVYIHRKHYWLGACDSVAQIMLVFFDMIDFEIVLFILFTHFVKVIVTTTMYQRVKGRVLRKI